MHRSESVKYTRYERWKAALWRLGSAIGLFTWSVPPRRRSGPAVVSPLLQAGQDFYRNFDEAMDRLTEAALQVGERHGGSAFLVEELEPSVRSSNPFRGLELLEAHCPGTEDKVMSLAEQLHQDKFLRQDVMHN